MNQSEPYNTFENLPLYLKLNPKAQKANGGGDCVELPFVCGVCQKLRFDLDMVDGDGKPICVSCIDYFTGIISGEGMTCLP